MRRAAFGPSDKDNDTTPSTRNRVPENTADSVNEEIERQIEERVRYCAGHPKKIAGRLSEIRERDIERAIEANAAAIGFSGIVLGATVGKNHNAPNKATLWQAEHDCLRWDYLSLMTF